MGVKLQLLLGLLLFGLVWGSTENITNSQNDSLEKVDSTNNLIEKLPKTDTQINLEKKDTQEDANDSLKYSKNGLHKSSETGQEENIENDRIGREGNSRSIDVEKFDSLDFQNNDYPAGNIKFLENAIRKSSTKGYNDFSKLQLTTPKTDFFDSKFKEAKQKLEQEFEDSIHRHPDEHQLEDEIDKVEHDDINIDRLFGNIKQKPNTTLDYKEKTKISRNNTIGDSSEYNEVRVVKMHNINIDSTFNFTTLDDEDTERRETTSQRERTEATSPRGFEVTTRKTITLTKPPANQNDHILSNKIESETIKAINLLSTEFSTERLRGENDVLAKEQIVEENKIFPLAEVITEHIKDTRLSSESTEASNDVITTEQIEHTTTVDELSTLEEKLATLFTQSTTVTNNEITTESLTTEISTITTTEQMENQTSLATEITTIKIEETTIETEKTNRKTEVTTLTSEESTLKSDESTLKTDGTTFKTDETTLKTDETTFKTDGTTLKTDGTTFKTDETTLKTEETTPKIEETTFKTEDTTPNTEESSTENLNRISKSFVFNSSFSILPQTTETTTEPIITTTDILTIINTGIETSTSTSTQETDTETTIKLVMPKRFEMNTTTEFKTYTQTTEPNGRINLTTIEFVHVTSKENNTTIMPDILIPNLNYSTSTSSTIRFKNINISEETTTRVTTVSSTEDYSDSTSTGSDVSGLGSGEENKGKIAAIVISTVGAVCLILLAGLLYIMRKRQKRFNYKQRCRPVSLDDYSVDNGYASTRRKAERQSKRSYGNPAFDDPVAVTHPLNFPALAKFANNTEDIKAEFEEIPQITAKTNELPEGCEVKNRYANVIPLPETRVYLQSIDGYPNSDYINANFVTGPKNTKGYYIACQAPMQNTVDDFWRMVWEQQTKVILMLTHLFENGVEKCIDYLPPSEVLDCNRLFGDFQVTLKKRDVKDKYIISNLQLKNMVSNSWREVTHFWYLGWPEKGVPLEENSIIAFLIEARSYMKSATLDKNAVVNGNLNGSSKNEMNPVVVHCSPGTGRTGVVIACDIAIREFEQMRLVDIPKIVYRIRRDRASAVQTKEQYIFIYKVISLYATKLTGGALESF